MLLSGARVLVDLGCLSLAYWGAFFLRFDGIPPLQMLKLLVFTWPYVVLGQYAILYLLEVPRFAWSYVGLREAVRILWGVGAASAAMLVARFASAWIRPHWGYALYTLIPIGVIAAYTLLALVGLVGVRALRRSQTERRKRRAAKRAGGERTLLVGAGSAGLLVARELAAHSALGIEPVGFVDDDVKKVGLIVHGLKVLGTTEHLEAIARRTSATQVLITTTHADRRAVQRIVETCRALDLSTKVIPGIYQLIEGKTVLEQIRDVTIDDLLGREPVTLDLEQMRQFVAGKTVMVTGAGGSIGSELCRQVSRLGPRRLLLVEQAEPALFSIHQELLTSAASVEVVPLIADVCDARRLGAVFDAWETQVVFHAAAHKHVPMMEWNPGEAIKNNVAGTMTLADAASAHGVESFVMVSTDKAVRPTSVMGATKRLAEMYVQALSQRSKTRFVAVRFGNVLGSAGSVVPIFQRQIAQGGPVTVTHPEMMRYFMTIPEASQLVIQAGAMGTNGQIFLLDMGEPVKIVDLARELVRLSGLVPDEDIEIRFTGVRPGEKLFEELAFDAEQMDRTSCPKIFVGRLSPQRIEEVREALQALIAGADGATGAELRLRLSELIPEFTGGPEPPPGTPVSLPPASQELHS